ncbi:hypothetical protein K439DRAFT_1544714 [Ramaria rubella]|nr:hypothetical protein K439DRAFT_1544714 [Ramaria rubella]
MGQTYVPDTIDNSFAERYFSLKGLPETIEDKYILRHYIVGIKAASMEEDMHCPVANLLNQLSIVAYKILRRERGSDSPLEALVFAATQNKTLTHDIFNAKLEPDLVAHLSTPESLQSSLASTEAHTPDLLPPWPRLESIIEIKQRGSGTDSQIKKYCNTILRYRPDKSLALGLSLDQVGYTLYAVDACIAKGSMKYSWDSEGTLERLFQFVYSNYLCRDHDTTLAVSSTDNNNYTRWQVSHGHTIYDMAPLVARRGASRRTWLTIGWILGAEHTVTRIIKDMWRDDNWPCDEGSFLEKIHKDGPVPGVVRLAAHGPVNNLVVGTSPDTRSKRRLIMASTGQRLSTCRSVLHFLKVMYDAIEESYAAHQHMVDQKVLHRDLSWYNILCYPAHHIGGKPVARPCIAELLSEDNPESCCLITDFDNAADIEDESSVADLTQTKGTSMFIAVDMSGGLAAHERIAPHAINEATFCLEGDTRESYINSYGTDTYDTFNEFIHSLATGNIPEIEPSGPVIHKPFHDVESVYWNIVWFLTRAWPENSDAETSRSPAYKEATGTMLAHQISEDEAGRIKLRQASAAEWASILHSQCSDLATMLSDMGSYMSVKWLRYPTTPTYHAHEALKRLLLKEIVRMTAEGTSIPVQGPRPLAATTPSTGSKLTAVVTSLVPSLGMLPSASAHAVGEKSQSRSRTPSPRPFRQLSKRKNQQSRVLTMDQDKWTAERWLRVFEDDLEWFK